LSRELSQILYLSRVADDRVHSDISVIAFCTLFENLVRVLFSELDLSNSVPDMKPEAFEKAKEGLLAHIPPELADGDPAYRRFFNIIKSAQFFRMDEMLTAVVAQLKINPDQMGKIFRTWKRARNPLVHETRRAEQSEAGIRDSILNESRIAGGINVLTLKAIGYSGWARISSFEDSYCEI
jgi:hypothetical protein